MRRRDFGLKDFLEINFGLSGFRALRLRVYKMAGGLSLQGLGLRV